MSRSRKVMTPAALRRAQRRELGKEIARLQAMAEQALAELDDHVASRLRQFKAEMAAAHPDRGGTTEAFIEARQRYLGAKRLAGVRRPT
jgi:hypothetical protein